MVVFHLFFLCFVPAAVHLCPLGQGGPGTCLWACFQFGFLRVQTPRRTPWNPHHVKHAYVTFLAALACVLRHAFVFSSPQRVHSPVRRLLGGLSLLYSLEIRIQPIIWRQRQGYPGVWAVYSYRLPVWLNLFTTFKICQKLTYKFDVFQ